MNPRIERIDREIADTTNKIEKLQAKRQELQKRRAEAENTEIIDTVRGSNISLADLAVLLKQKNGGTQ